VLRALDYYQHDNAHTEENSKWVLWNVFKQHNQYRTVVLMLPRSELVIVITRIAKESYRSNPSTLEVLQIEIRILFYRAFKQEGNKTTV
jgi:hypothetical protein